MPSLSVRGFACIVEADLELASLTVLTGPQASGKSLISKLIYFFNELFLTAIRQDMVPYQQYHAEMEKKFVRWFPITAWGSKKFNITYKVAGLEFGFIRRKSSARSLDRVSFSASVEFEEFYKAAYDALMVAATEEPREGVSGQLGIRAYFDVRRVYMTRLAERMGREATNNQLYVPAGRSFFLNVEKAYSAAREVSGLDPITDDFGLIFTHVRSSIEKGRGIYPLVDLSDKTDLSADLLGGKVEIQSENIVLRAADNRVLPVNVLSSGQQELLPLWIMMNYWGLGPRSLFYIEEPEAHLFPASQSLLTEFLIATLNKAAGAEDQGSGRMIITTHSPYILSKINNLLKAGSLGSSDRSAAKRVNAVVHQSNWLRPGSTVAYGIISGKIISLMDDQGLIDSLYLDDISNSIVDEFSSLQDLELGE